MSARVWPIRRSRVGPCAFASWLVPASTLKKLGIRPHGSRSFILADGREITRPIGDAIFIMDDQRAASPVIFGEEDDAALLGSVCGDAP